MSRYVSRTHLPPLTLPQKQVSGRVGRGCFELEEMAPSSFNLLNSSFFTQAYQLIVLLPFFFFFFLFFLQTSRGTDVSKYISFIHPPPFSLKLLSGSTEEQKYREKRNKLVSHRGCVYFRATLNRMVGETNNKRLKEN